MKRKAFAKAAVASMLIGTTMVGCTGAAFRTTAAVAPQKPDRLAAGVEKALADRDGARAVELAEAAVQAAPQDAAIASCWAAPMSLAVASHRRKRR